MSPEDIAAIAIMSVAVFAAAVMVFVLGSPQVVIEPSVELPRFDIYDNSGKLMMSTDDPETAERARIWYRGEVVDTWIN